MIDAMIGMDLVCKAIYQNYVYGLESNCCGAKVLNGDICSECFEHCECVEIEEE